MLKVLAVLDQRLPYDGLLEKVEGLKGIRLTLDSGLCPPSGAFDVLLSDRRDTSYAMKVRGLRFWAQLNAIDAEKIGGVLCISMPSNSDFSAILDYLEFMSMRERIAHQVDPFSFGG